MSRLLSGTFWRVCAWIAVVVMSIHSLAVLAGLVSKLVAGAAFNLVDLLLLALGLVIAAVVAQIVMLLR